MKHSAAILFAALASGFLLAAAPDAVANTYGPVASYKPARPHKPLTSYKPARPHKPVTSYTPANPHKCRTCPPPKKYDSTEVVRESKTVDHSKVINTYEVVHRRQASRPRLVYARPSVTVVNNVVHNYRITYGPHPNNMVPMANPHRPACQYVSHRGNCVLRVRG